MYVSGGTGTRWQQGRAGAGRADAARQKARDRARRPPDDAGSLVLSRLGLISRFLGIVCSLRYHGDDWLGTVLGGAWWCEGLGASTGHQAESRV